jgi:hypothetical protein
VPGGRICKLCADSHTMKRAAQLIAEGVSDQSIADQLGLAGAAGRMVVQRHRTRHVEAPARAVAEAASKGRQAVTRREGLVAAAEAGDLAAAFIGLEEIAADLKRVRDRLERAAEAAEVDQQRLAVASLSGQQLRAVEVRAKLGGVGGYATPRNDKSDAAPFVLNIVFSGGRTQRIEGVPIDPDDPAFNAVPARPVSIGRAGPAHGGTSQVEPSDDETGLEEAV